MLLYLEQLDAASIAEITGLSAANVATKVSRIKQILIQRCPASQIIALIVGGVPLFLGVHGWNVYTAHKLQKDIDAL